MYKKILVPLDGSELAEQVLPLVIELASGSGAEIILLRVPDIPIYETMMAVPDFNMQVREQAEREAREYLARLSSDLRGRGLKVRTHIALTGAVYFTILQTAREFDIDVIAMSTHGRSGLARLVMGSVADDVVRHADLPVLLVRPQPARNHKPAGLARTFPAHPAQ